MNAIRIIYQMVNSGRLKVEGETLFDDEGIIVGIETKDLLTSTNLFQHGYGRQFYNK